MDATDLGVMIAGELCADAMAAILRLKVPKRDTVVGQSTGLWLTDMQRIRKDAALAVYDAFRQIVPNGTVISYVAEQREEPDEVVDEIDEPTLEPCVPDDEPEPDGVLDYETPPIQNSASVADLPVIGPPPIIESIEARGPKPPDRVGFICDDCGKEFPSKSALGGHRRWCTKAGTNGDGPPRVCADVLCETILSSGNKTKYCGVHWRQRSVV